MYCHSCGASLPKGTSFCSACGKRTPGQHSDYGALQDASTLTPTPKPYDPYMSQASAFHESQTTVEGWQNAYPPLAPPPPPEHHSIPPRFRKGLFTSILVILLVSGSLAAWLILRQGALSPSVPHSVRPKTTPQSTVQSVISPTATPQATADTTSQFLPGTWTQCSVETVKCSFSGTMTVAFGANGSFNYATESNGIACTTAIFGDPLHGTQKACYLEAAPPTKSVWDRCAAEDATCTFLGTMTVAFGANGSYKYETQANGSACTTGAFGDPSYGVVKSCYLISPPGSAATWNVCATENSTCSFAGSHEVAYGAKGRYFYGSFTNGTTCANSVFDDPAIGATKTCYYQ